LSAFSGNLQAANSDIYSRFRQNRAVTETDWDNISGASGKILSLYAGFTSRVPAVIAEVKSRFQYKNTGVKKIGKKGLIYYTIVR